MGMPCFLGSLGASAFLVSGTGAILEVPPSGGAGALAFIPSVAPWAVTYLDPLFYIFFLSEEVAPFLPLTFPHGLAWHAVSPVFKDL